MLRTVAIAILLSAASGSALAQFTDQFALEADAARTVGDFEAFAASHPAAPDILHDLLGLNDNLYVYFVQGRLSEEGLYGGSVDGLLTRPTIRAINAYCADRDAAEQCRMGPLTSDAADVLSMLFSQEPETETAVVEAEAEPAQEPEATKEAAATGSSAGVDGNNLVFNAVMEGAVPGTPGTMPTGWRVVAQKDGVSRSVVSGAEDGLELRFHGTPTANGTFFVPFGTRERAGVTVAPGVEYSASAIVALVNGDWSGIRRINLQIPLFSAEGEFSEVMNPAGFIEHPEASLYELRRSGFAEFEGEQYARPNFRFDYSEGTAIDITLRIEMPYFAAGTE